MARRRGAPFGLSFAPTDEAFRIIRSNLQIALSDLERAVVIVTSANAAEGKTAVTVGLARAFADAGVRVVLVDLDLRRPNAHLPIGAHNEVGVTDVLLGRRNLEDCLQFVELPGPRAGGLYFLGTGDPVSNPAELLGVTRTSRMIEGLAAQADLVLIDTPPVLPVADTLVIGRMAAGAVLVVEHGGTPMPAARKAKDLLIRNQTRLLGVVLNKVDGADGFGYGYTTAGYSPRTPVEHGGDDGAPDGDGGRGRRRRGRRRRAD